MAPGGSKYFCGNAHTGGRRNDCGGGAALHHAGPLQRWRWSVVWLVMQRRWRADGQHDSDYSFKDSPVVAEAAALTCYFF